MSKRGTVTSGNIKVQWSGSTQALTDSAVWKKDFPLRMRANLVQPELVDRAVGQGELNHIFGGKVSCVTRGQI